MEILENFLKDYLPKKEQVFKSCCNNKDMILSENLIRYVCRNCGSVNDNIYTIDDIEKFKGNYVKTFIGYSSNSKLRSKMYRLQKWSNYDRLDVKMNEYIIFIDKLPIENENIKNNSKMLFKDLLPRMNIRGNNRKALMCYCLYKSHLKYKVDVDLDDLMLMLNINFKNYNDTNKKIPEEKIFYIENLNYYLGLIDNKINKNYLISIYNIFYNISDEFNKKTLVIGLIFYLLKNNDYSFRKEFINLFNISDNSLYVILFHINQNKNIIYKYNTDE